MNSCSKTQLPPPLPLPNTPQIPTFQIFDQPPISNLHKVELLEKVDTFSNRTFRDLMSEAFDQSIPYYIAFSHGLDNQLRPYDAFSLIAYLNAQKNDPNRLQSLANGALNPGDNFQIYRVTRRNPGTLKYFSRFKELNNNCDHKLKFIYAAAPSSVRPKVIAESSYYRATVLKNDKKKLKWFVRGSNYGSHKASLELFLRFQEKGFPELARFSLTRALEQVQSKKKPTEKLKLRAIARAYISELSQEEINRFKL